MVQPPRPAPMFPTYLWSTSIDEETRASMDPAIDATVRKILADELKKPLVKTHQTHQQLHHMPEFAPLVAAAVEAGGAILDAFDAEQRDMVMTGCWANLGVPQASHVAHHHPNNFLSGVYYPVVPSGGDRIVFHDPRPQTQIIVPRFKKYNQYNGSGVTVGIKAGAMLLFPAWLTHSVPSNNSQGERLSIAFNLNFVEFTKTVSPPRWDGTGVT